MSIRTNPNNIVPTAPAGTSDNRAASTAFATTNISAAQLVAMLMSANNAAPALRLYNTSDTSKANFFGSNFEVLVSGAQGGIVGSAIQNTQSNTFPRGVTAGGWLSAGGAGQQVFALFARATAEVAGGASNEFDVFNNTASDAPSTFPRGDSFGTGSVWTTAATLASGGTTGKANWAGVYIVKDPTAPGTAQFNFGIGMHAQACKLYGLFCDSDATNSPQFTAYLRNTGANGNVPLTTQTMATAIPTNPVYQNLNPSGGITFQILQNGNVWSNANASTALTPPAGNPQFWGVNADGANGTLALDTYGTPFVSSVTLRTARGTGASPTTLVAGDAYGILSGNPALGGPPATYTAQGPVRISWIWTDSGSNQGSAIAFATSPNGATGNRAEAGRFHGSGGFSVGNTTDLGIGTVFANTDLYSNDATFLIRTKTTLTNSAAAQVATLTNGPTAGNPTKWFSIDDNGTTRRIPAW